MSGKNTPLVSVIVPCYKLGKYLDDAVNSVKTQTMKSWELIVVDDGSPDQDTKNTIKRIKSDNPHFLVLSQKNAGPSSARNNGISKAKGEYIVCLDADDVLAPEYLEKTAQILHADKTKKLGFVTTWVQEFGERNSIWKTGDFDMPKMLIANCAHAGSMFRKESWEQAGGYKEGKIQGYEDWEFWLNVVEQSYEWVSIHEPLFRYRIRKNSLLSTARSTHQEKYELLYNFHRKLFESYSKEVIIQSARDVADLHDAIKAKNDAIEQDQKSIIEYKKAIEYYKSEAAVAAERLDSLHRSRITQVALKLIGISIALRTELPELKRKLSTSTKSLLPSYFRTRVKRAARKLFPKKVVITKNEKWDKRKPLVSIVTPFYNHAAVFPETLESVLNQTYKNIEYIIIDDGSEPEQSRALDKMSGVEDKRITVVHYEENIGKGSPAAARNDGIQRASGKYIMCLDSDDTLEPTYIEKCLVSLETAPDRGLVTTNIRAFGVENMLYEQEPYDALRLLDANMVSTAAMFRKEAWESVGGYKLNIGYEDWDFWISLAERGYFGTYIPEALFNYRTATVSRYVEDKKKHRDNIRNIHQLHPDYKKVVRKLRRKKSRSIVKVESSSAFANMDQSGDYRAVHGGENILIAIPWMTFGGAETLVLNFCREIKDKYNISFVTGLTSDHEWESKFKLITPNIYHLANLFGENRELYIEFVSNYIKSRGIDILHIVHTSFMFDDTLKEIRIRHPGLKIVVTMFNDRAHFDQSLDYADYIDAYATDNKSVADKYQARLTVQKPVSVIPNGINCYDIFNPDLFVRSQQRFSLGIDEDDLAVFFIGRLSEEKNPDVFLDVAKIILSAEGNEDVKFFIVGDGPMRVELEKMLVRIGSENVQYLGYQSEVAQHLSAADIFVLPSSIEGFPLSIPEAMAMKVAVIASDVGAVSEVVEEGKTGFVVSPGSASEIADKIEILKQDKKLLENMKVSARKKVEAKYSNTILGKNYTKLYEGLLK